MSTQTPTTALDSFSNATLDARDALVNDVDEDTTSEGQHMNGSVEEHQGVLLNADARDLASLESRQQSKRGRPQSTIWEVFTEAPEPQKSKSNVCKHCKIQVNYHKKSEAVKTHLKKCSGFRAYVATLEENERPDWYTQKKKPATKSKAASSLHSDDDSSSRDPAESVKVKDEKFKGERGSKDIKGAKDLKSLFQQNIAMHFYSTGTPFQNVECVHFQEAFRILSPDANCLPTPKQLETALLDKCYNDLRAKVDERLSKITTCLTCGVVSSTQDKIVTNYLAESHTGNLFLETVTTSSKQSQDPKYVVTDISRVMRLQKSTNFAGAVTNNTDTNKKAWKILREKFPSRFFHGCWGQSLHLMVKDIFGATKSKRGGRNDTTYPDGYPFARLNDFVKDCLDVVEYFQHNDQLKQRLRDEQKAANLRPLARVDPTRWGSIHPAMSTLLESERLLRAIVLEPDFVNGSAALAKERTEIRAIITDNDFVQDLKKILLILAPVHELITKSESSKALISEVLPDFNALSAEFNKLWMEKIITVKERDYLSKICKERFEFMYGVAHGLSYLLDPALLGEDLNVDDRRSLEDILLSIPIEDTQIIDETHREKMYVQITAFMVAAVTDKTANSFRYQMLAKRKKLPLEWWLIDGSQFPDLQKVAVKLFSMAVSSTASERNFSPVEVIPFKIRKTLSPKSIKKLVYLRSNLSTIYNSPVSDDAADTSSEFDTNDNESTIVGDDDIEI